MFYENFERLCKENGTSPSAALVSLGKSRSLASAWKRNGTIPKSEELKELADLLHCRVADFFDSPSDQVLLIHRSITTPEAKVEKLKKGFEKYFFVRESDGKEEKEPVDDNIADFIAIYHSANNRQRNQLMSAVYDFEEKVLNNDGN